MPKKEHYTKLENIYKAAPINQFYLSEIIVSEGKAQISMMIKEDFFHAANAVHGAVYFKMLDDAAYFAANSCVEDVFVLTGTFETKLLKPISSGKLIAKGTLLTNFGNKLEAQAQLFDDNEQLIAAGKGIFIKSKLKLLEIPSYKI